jgi:penicillin-insensitive murein endopeptidase
MHSRFKALIGAGGLDAKHRTPGRGPATSSSTISRVRQAGLALICLVCASSVAADEQASRCFGSVAHGRIEHAVQLPPEGRNYRAYSGLANSLGRTYLHSRVREVVMNAYAELEKSALGKVYVYGETGLAKGGRFRPHRTHQNGLSVDFMVPVVDAAGRSMPLPTSTFNKFGYGIEFDSDGRHDNYRIDFEALAEHLYQLHAAASAQGVGIGLVIFEPSLHARLFATRRGEFLRSLSFMKKPAWIRHDNHYHVDFVVPCSSLK